MTARFTRPESYESNFQGKGKVITFEGRQTWVYATAFTFESSLFISTSGGKAINN